MVERSKEEALEYLDRLVADKDTTIPIQYTKHLITIRNALSAPTEWRPIELPVWADFLYIWKQADGTYHSGMGQLDHVDLDAGEYSHNHKTPEDAIKGVLDRAPAAPSEVGGE